MYLESMKLSGVPGPSRTQGYFQSFAFCLRCTWQRNSSRHEKLQVREEGVPASYHSKSVRQRNPEMLAAPLQC